MFLYIPHTEISKSNILGFMFLCLNYYFLHNIVHSKQKEANFFLSQYLLNNPFPLFHYIPCEY